MAARMRKAWTKCAGDYYYMRPPSAYICAYRYGRGWAWKLFFKGGSEIEGRSCSADSALAAAERRYLREYSGEELRAASHDALLQQATGEDLPRSKFRLTNGVSL